MSSDVQDYLSLYLSSIGYSPVPLMDSGPASDAMLQKRSPHGLVFVTVGAGGGLTSEGYFDRPFIIVRSIGKQNDPDGAERQALDIDIAFLSVDSNRQIGNAKVLYITRAGGRPSLLEQDNAERYHWQCTYITETPTGL